MRTIRGAFQSVRVRLGLGLSLAPELRANTVFDRAKYDRLRVLTTELKRVVRDGGELRVHFGPRTALPQRWLLGALRVV